MQIKNEGTCLYVRSASVGHCFHICVFSGSYTFLQVTCQQVSIPLLTAEAAPADARYRHQRQHLPQESIMQVTATRGGTCYNPRKSGNRLIAMNSFAVLFLQLFLSVSLAEGFLHIARHHHHTSPASPHNSNATVSRVKRAETNTGLSTYTYFLKYI